VALEAVAADITEVAPILLVALVRRAKAIMAASESQIQPALMVLVAVAARELLAGKVETLMAVLVVMARPIPFLAPQLLMAAAVVAVAIAEITAPSGDRAAAEGVAV
jgi:hypothetical protein